MRREEHRRSTPFRRDDTRPAATVRLALSESGHARRDGEYRGVLEAGMEHSRRALHDSARERSKGQSRPRKEDSTKDCQWIADLVQHGLLRGSFIPPTPIRELRDLTRMRASLRQDHTSVANRMQKVLEDANIKLAAVASDWLGVSGRVILSRLLDGEEDAEKLAQLCRGRLREKMAEMQMALEGRVRRHHRWLLTLLRNNSSVWKTRSQTWISEFRIACASTRKRWICAPQFPESKPWNGRFPWQ
jgi:hypothetical protein